MKSWRSRDVLPGLRRAVRAGAFAGLAFGSMMPLAPAAEAEDLLSVYRLAVNHDPRFRAASAAYQAVRQRVPQARAGFLPQVSAKLSRDRNDEEVVTDTFIFSRPAGQARYYSNTYEVTLSQTLYNKALWAGLDQAGAEVRRAHAQYRAARQDLILRVTDAYFSVLLAQDTLALAEAERDMLARNLETAEGRREAGSGTIIEEHDARARYQLAAAQVIEARNQLNDGLEALREITGRLPGDLDGLREGARFTAPDPPDPRSWIDFALTQNLEVRAAKEALEVARLEIERNRAAHFPVLQAIGSHSRYDADASIPGPGVRADNTVVGLQLSIPLYQGGAVSALTEEAVYRYDEAREELEARRRAVTRSTRAAFHGVMANLARIEALEQAVDAAESALEAKTEGRDFGLYTTLDVLDATRDLFRAKRDHAEARHAYLSNFLQLKYTAGLLTEEDVLAVNVWLER